MRNPLGINFFGPRVVPGTPLARVPLADKVNLLCAVLSNLQTENGITLTRDGERWTISFSPSLSGLNGAEGGGGSLTTDTLTDTLTEYGTITDPAYVLGKKTDGTIGWVEVTTHASQHPE
jgi:hypothetical protein